MVSPSDSKEELADGTVPGTGHLAEHGSSSSPMVPGTVHLVEQGPSSGHIVLVPQPSDDPEDPLNWPRWRKWLNVSLVLLYVFTTGIGGTSVYSILVPISEDTGITLAELNNGTAYLFLLAGWSNLLWQPLALTFGRRPVYLASLLGCVAMSEWAAYVGTSAQWAACRCLFGFWVAPVEVLPELSVAELFFAHERGAWTGVYMLVLSGSNYIAPLVAGFMNEAYGWRWVQHWCAIVLAANFALSFFFYEDTMYQRSTVETDVTDESGAPVLTVASERHFDSALRKLTYCDKMKLWRLNPLVDGSGFFAMMWRPLYMFFALPIVAWCGFFYGIALAWYNVYNATSSSILSGQPYNFDSSAVGLSYLAPLVGALIGGFLSGPVSDRATLALARRNGGVREPEQRLWGLVLYNVLLPAGLLLWGVGAYHQVPWMALMFAAAIIAVGNVLGGSYSLAYLVDSYKDISGEALVSVILCRNTMSFGFNYAITPWIDRCGLQTTFIVVAVLSLVTGLTFLGMIWKGKALRRQSAERHWRLAETQIITH